MIYECATEELEQGISFGGDICEIDGREWAKKRAKDFKVLFFVLSVGIRDQSRQVYARDVVEDVTDDIKIG